VASVELRGLTKRYGGLAVVDNVSQHIGHGSLVCLLGPSGCGKTTTLRLLAGFLEPSDGEIHVGDRLVSSKARTLPPEQRKMSMIFQSYALWPHMTVWDNVAFGLVERKVDRATLKARVGAALELVGLQDYGARRPSQLSGGQQQRVALARTVVIEPKVLLLDEPLSNLDKTLRVQMRQELLALQRRLGITTLFVTHDQEEAMTTADRMAVLDQGVVQQVGAPAALYDEPVNAFVAQFVGTMNLLPGRVRERRGDGLTLAVEGVGELAVPLRAGAPPGETLMLSFRPHSLRMGAAGAAQVSSCIALTGTVEAREFLGEVTRYRVRVGTHSLAVDHPHRAGGAAFLAGDVVSLALEPSEARLLAR
jgi:iron(III) transport system ATP-binding protein